MPKGRKPNEKLAGSMAALGELQKHRRKVFESKELRRVDRERLLRNGFLREVMKGWLISSSPSVREGDSTPWYASFWEFCARYCRERFGDDWHFSPEQSLLLAAENTVVPKQVVVYTPKGTNNTVELLFGTSLYDLKQADVSPATEITVRDGLRLVFPAAALVKVSEAFYIRNPIEAQVVLASIRDASDILPRLLEDGRSHFAGRLAGAFRRGGRAHIADEILATMKTAGYDVRETDPFKSDHTIAVMRPPPAPIVGRMQAMWDSMRGAVLESFPKVPGLPKNKKRYLRFVDDIYKSDAYHSLSIEGYSVTLPLIERVRVGNWDPDSRDDDRQNRDALAARGYWQAFQNVKATVEKIIGGANAGAIVRTVHKDWYRELFQPCIAAGLLPARALAGYRNEAVYLRTSRYVPPRWEAVRDAMTALFDLLEQESEPGVRAVLGHWLFGYIHPYPDGNGRMARFLMNAMLASGGYPWTVVRIEDRKAYLRALDQASIEMKIEPFAAFIAERVAWSLQEEKK